MSQLVKLLGERRSGAYRKIDGASGKLYLFRWIQPLTAYVFETDKQIEVDDLFKRQPPGMFAPILPVTSKAATPPPAEIAAEQEKIAVMAQVVMEMGVEVKPTDSLDTIIRLGEAYDKGRSSIQADLGAPLPTTPAAETPQSDAPAAPDVPSPAPADEPPAATESAEPAAPPEVEPELTSDEEEFLMPKAPPRKLKEPKKTKARKKAEPDAVTQERIAAGLEEPPETGN